jgi:2-amino-4-hydroxy-6-hydroxymethyldihydropteridine diphosphokinase
MARVYLSLGTNQGDRFRLLREADALLSATFGIQVVARSSVYETEPVGPVDQPWFLNQVLAIETSLAPPALLEAAQKVERSLGRTRALRWGPRFIDVDLLLYEGHTVASARLTIPHPELPHRRFVLLPLVEIDPLLRLPDGRAIVDLLEALGEVQTVRRLDASP